VGAGDSTCVLKFLSPIRFLITMAAAHSVSLTWLVMVHVFLLCRQTKQHKKSNSHQPWLFLVAGGFANDRMLPLLIGVYLIVLLLSFCVRNEMSNFSVTHCTAAKWKDSLVLCAHASI
jgi:hypothetical protein